MAFADDLLGLAQHLASLYPDNPHQASLRRAVSTAYYALFHLLVSEATLNWARVELRPALGRVFDHGPMKTAADIKIAQLNAFFKGNPPDGPEREVAWHLRFVANAFVQAQQRRHDADYNTGKEWTREEVQTQIDAVAEAFKSWNVIRDEAHAQAYLVSLLGSKERRQNEPPRPPKRTEQKKKRTKPESPPPP